MGVLIFVFHEEKSLERSVRASPFHPRRRSFFVENSVLVVIRYCFPHRPIVHEKTKEVVHIINIINKVNDWNIGRASWGGVHPFSLYNQSKRGRENWTPLFSVLIPLVCIPGEFVYRLFPGRTRWSGIQTKLRWGTTSHTAVVHVHQHFLHFYVNIDYYLLRDIFRSILHVPPGGGPTTW